MTQSAVTSPEGADDAASRPLPPQATDVTKVPQDPERSGDSADVVPDEYESDTDTVKLYVPGGFRFINLPTADGSSVLRLGPDPVPVDADAADEIIQTAADNGVTVLRVQDETNDEDEVQA